MKKLDRPSAITRLVNENGSPTGYEITLRQKMSEAIETLATAGDLTDLAGGASTADIIAKVNQILAIARSIP